MALTIQSRVVKEGFAGISDDDRRCFHRRKLQTPKLRIYKRRHMKPILSSILLVTTLVFGTENLWCAQFNVRNTVELRDALTIAEENGEADKILIFQGVYIGNFRYASTETASLQLVGGFSDGNEPSLDPSKTVLDGGQHGTVLSIAMVANSGNIKIQNLTIQNGRGLVGGGGILLGQYINSGSGFVYLLNNIVQNNSTSENGGGVRIDLSAINGGNSILIMQDNIIRENRADKSGGGAYLTADMESDDSFDLAGGIYLIGNEITGNDSDWSGGGVNIWSDSKTRHAGHVALSSNSINYNECHTSWNPNDICNGGGVNVGISSYGGTGEHSPINIINNEIMNNKVTGYGGGVQVSSISQNGVGGTITLDRNRIFNNEAFGGGGAKVSAFADSPQTQSGDIRIFSNNIHGNSAKHHYGGIAAGSSSISGQAGNVVVVNNMITSNRTDGWYGGLSASSYTVDGSGGSVTLTNNTISANEAGEQAGGVGAMVMPGEDLNFYNNIIRDNFAPSGGDIVVGCEGYGATQRGFNNNYAEMFGVWSNEGNNINQNPLFVSGDDFHLQTASVCKDAGTALAPEFPPTDFEGDPRVFGSAPDMGADEIGMIFIKPPFLSNPQLNR